MMINTTTTQFLCVLAVFSLLAFVFVAQNPPQIYSQFVNKSRSLTQVDLDHGSGDDSQEVIRILYATRLFNRRYWQWGEGPDALSACPNMIGRCEFTANKSLIKQSDALLFFIRNPVGIHFRRPHQKWIFAINESPMYTHKKLGNLEDKFNLTMTYSHSAENDIAWSYGRCSRITDDDPQFQSEQGSSAPLNITAADTSSRYVNYAEGKKYLAAWFVGNCIANSRREMYVNEMQRYADIHVYGCGPYSCPPFKKKYCDVVLLNNDYKFYLSFENSFCTDYATEKVWRAMSINIVPVVLGLANYSQLLPPHSYIDVRDFASPKHLVEYLKLLDANDSLYNEYFRWKTHYRCGAVSHNIACDLCRYLHDTRGRQQNVKNLTSFWGIENNCVDFRTFYRTLGVDADAWPTMEEAIEKRTLERKKEAMNKLKSSAKIREEGEER